MFDYYINTDEYVVRKHAEMLADAGVDVIFFDCTNGTYLWQPAYETVFEVFAQAREQGVDTPQVAFMLNFGAGADTKTQLQTLYKDLYSEGKYSDLWFLWDGKPLVLLGNYGTPVISGGQFDTEVNEEYLQENNVIDN